MRTSACLMVTFLLGCGGPPSNLDICHANCEYLRQCIGVSDGATASCHQGCDNNRGKFSDDDRKEDQRCRNAGAIRHQKMQCHSRACGQVPTCLLTVDACVPY